MKHPHHKPYPSLHAPWSLEFDRDGTEDFGIIRDAEGDELVTSRQFWLPEPKDPYPVTLYALRVMTAAPELKEALSDLLACTISRYRNTNEEPFILEHEAMQAALKALLKAGTQ